MEVRRATLAAAIRLATVLSIVAAVFALTLDAVSDVSRTSVVALVVVIGFVSSWIQTSRVSRAFRRSHRMAVIPIRQPVG
jgi:uncharacterized membrane protein YGL010W